MEDPFALCVGQGYLYRFYETIPFWWVGFVHCFSDELVRWMSVSRGAILHNTQLYNSFGFCAVGISSGCLYNLYYVT